MQSALEQAYSAIERSYAQGHFPEALEQAMALQPQLEPGRADLLDQRLQLLIGHIHLYGLAQPQQAELAYGAVLNQCNEAGYRRLAEQGLAQCQGEPATEPQAREPEPFNLPATPWLAQLRDPQQALAEIQQAWASVPAATPAAQPEPQPLAGSGIAASPWDSAAQAQIPETPPVTAAETDSPEPDSPDTDGSEPAGATSSEQTNPETTAESVADELDKGLLLVKLSSPGGQRD
ncbi:MAG: hypothetical protein RLZZ54_1060 [Cyanobacteriota bacterium]|jgi:hypothetical protein